MKQQVVGWDEARILKHNQVQRTMVRATELCFQFWNSTRENPHTKISYTNYKASPGKIRTLKELLSSPQRPEHCLISPTISPGRCITFRSLPPFRSFPPLVDHPMEASEAPAIRPSSDDRLWRSLRDLVDSNPENREAEIQPSASSRVWNRIFPNFCSLFL